MAINVTVRRNSRYSYINDHPASLAEWLYRPRPAAHALIPNTDHPLGKLAEIGRQLVLSESVLHSPARSLARSFALPRPRRAKRPYELTANATLSCVCNETIRRLTSAHVFLYVELEIHRFLHVVATPISTSPLGGSKRDRRVVERREEGEGTSIQLRR